MKYGNKFSEESVKVTLKNLSINSKSKEKISDGNSFVIFYYNSLAIFKAYANAVQNLYMIKKLKEMPELSAGEIDDYIYPKYIDTSGDDSFFDLFLGLFFFLFFFLKKKESNSIKTKLDFIASACDHLLFTIENPMFAKAIENQSK